MEINKAIGVITATATSNVEGIAIAGTTVVLVVGSCGAGDGDDIARDENDQCRYKARSQCVVTKTKKGNKNVDERIFTCGLKDCGKKSHFLCFSDMVQRNKTGISGITIGKTENGCDLVLFACGLRCYNRCLKHMVEDRNNTANRQSSSSMKFWDNDSIDNGPSSMDVLLEWISDSSNAEKYFGAKDSGNAGFDADDGLTKTALCNQIAQVIQSRTGSTRNSDAVRKKIDQLVSDFKKTSDWIANTGQGVKLEHTEESWTELVLSLNKYYYVLEPVLGERPSTRPAFTSDDIDGLESFDSMSIESSTSFPADDASEELDDRNKSFESMTSVSEVSNQNVSEGQRPATVRNTSAVSAVPSTFKTKDKSSSEGSGGGGKRPATAARDAAKQEKKKNRLTKSNSAMQSTVVLGGSDKMDGYLERKMMYLNAQLSNEQARIELEKGRYAMEQETHKIKEKAVIAKANIDMAESNLRMMKLRKEAKEVNPDISQQELDELFPLLFTK